ncbi:MAG TPA: hypothetical protein VGD57_00775, partial [Candidatus Dormibacteraeota bacterium]
MSAEGAVILKLGPPSSASAAAMSTGAAKAAYVRRVREDQFAVDGRALRLFVSNVRFPLKLHVRLGSVSARLNGGTLTDPCNYHFSFIKTLIIYVFHRS